MTSKRRSFEKLGASLDAMSPLRVLARGYSITENSAGKPVRSVREISEGDQLSVRLTDGRASCRVESITKGE